MQVEDRAGENYRNQLGVAGGKRMIEVIGKLRGFMLGGLNVSIMIVPTMTLVYSFLKLDFSI